MDDLRLAIADRLYRQENWPAYLAELCRLQAEDPADPSCARRLLRFYRFEQPDSAAALRVAENALATSSPDQHLLLEIADAFTKAQKPDRAGEALAKGAAVFRSQRMLRAYADHQYAQGEFDAFIVLARACLRFNPWQYSLLKKMGKACVEIDDLAQASLYFNILALLRAQRASDDSKDLSRAAKATVTAIGSNPDRGLFALDLGEITRSTIIDPTSPFALLCYSSSNIGDEIQSLAVLNQIGPVSEFCNRDRLSNAAAPKAIVLNGWYAHDIHFPKEIGKLEFSWPPNKELQPTFLSFHLSDEAAPFLLTPSGIRYFKNHAPIGCRDRHTQRILQRHGIRTFFTGCATLTLPERKRIPNDGPIVFSDLPAEASSRLDEYFAERGFRTRHLTHSIPAGQGDNVERLSLAHTLLEYYASARLVVTSRLHAALPCLAMQVPVVLIRPRQDDRRFEGAIEWLNCEPLAAIMENPACLMRYLDSPRRDHLHIKYALEQKLAEFRDAILKRE